MWYYSWTGVDILVRKNRLVMNWYIFLGHEHSIFGVNHLIGLKTLKKQKFIWFCPPETPPGFFPRPQDAITIALQLLCPL